MRPMVTLRNTVSIATVSALLALSPLANAQRIKETPSAGAMVADAVIARPLYFLLSQAGSAVYAVTLPFTLMGGNSDQAAETLVVTPLQAAFVRCLGCRQVENRVTNLSEDDGSKRIRHFVMLNGGMSFLNTTDENEAGPGFGAYMGTHFALSDKSRFDVMLGVKRLADIEIETAASTFTDTTMSYQVVSRFGRDLGGFDLMFKLGGHYWSTERETSVGVQPELSASGVGFLYGLGADAWVSEGVRLGLDYTHYNMENTSKGYDAGLGTVDLNLSFVF